MLSNNIKYISDVLTNSVLWYFLKLIVGLVWEWKDTLHGHWWITLNGQVDMWFVLASFILTSKTIWREFLSSLPNGSEISSELEHDPSRWIIVPLIVFSCALVRFRLWHGILCLFIMLVEITKRGIIFLCIVVSSILSSIK